MVITKCIDCDRDLYIQCQTCMELKGNVERMGKCSRCGDAICSGCGWYILNKNIEFNPEVCPWSCDECLEDGDDCTSVFYRDHGCEGY